MVGLIRKRIQSAEAPATHPVGSRLLRVLRRILTVALLAAAGLVIVLTIAFLFAPSRNAMLGWGVRFADEALPGSLTVGDATWPSLGRLILKDLLWISEAAIAPGDTLAEVAVIDLTLDLGALKSREGKIESLVLDVRQVDVPAIAEATANMAGDAGLDPTESAPASPPKNFPFLHQGGLPGFPSAVLDQLDLEVDLARLAPGISVQDLVFSGRADFRGDRPAVAVVEHVEARLLAAVADSAGAPVWEVALDHLGLGLKLEASADETGSWTMDAVELDSLDLEIAPLANPQLTEIWHQSESVILQATGEATRSGSNYTGRLDCEFVLPGAARFHPWLPEGFPYEEFRSVAGHLALEGGYDDPLAQAILRLDLGSNSWLDTGLIVGSAAADLQALKSRGWEQLTARLDTLDIDLKGVLLEASGNWGPTDADLVLDVNLTDFRLPGMVLGSLDPALKEIVQDMDQVNLAAKADLERRGPRYSGTLASEFLLPGADHFQAWLPEDFPCEEFESLQGDLSVAGDYENSRAGATLRLDLGASPWVDKGLVSGAATADLDSLKVGGLRALTARLENLELALHGVDLSAAGELEPGRLDLDLEAALTDFHLPGLFAGDDLKGAEVDVGLAVAVGGSLEEPGIDALAQGSFRQETLAIPTFEFQLQGDRTNVAAFVRAGGGLVFEGTSLDSLRAEVQGRMVALDSMAVNFGLAAWQGTNHVAVGGAVRGDTVREVRVDSLILAAFDRHMRTRAPVTFTMGPQPGVFQLTELDFAGDPGSVTAQGAWNEETMDLAAGVDLLVTEDLLQLLVPAPLWSFNGGVDLKLDASADLEGTDQKPEVVGQVRAIMLPHRDEPPFGVDLSFNSLGGVEAVLNADLAVTSADTSLLTAQLVWPGVAGTERGFWQPDPQRNLTVTVPSQDLDLDRINRRLPEQMVLHGRFSVAAEASVYPPGEKAADDDSLATVPLRGNIDATLATHDLRIDLPNRSWLTAAVDASFSGPLKDPTLGARVEVTSGFIRIPEMARNLHPVEGESLLWALNDSLLAAMDSTTTDSLAMGSPVVRRDSLQIFVPPNLEGPQLDRKGPAFLPDLDLEVVIRDDLRIIGYGVDLKLGGNVAVARGFDADGLPGPAVTGDIRATEGNVKVMNRVFLVERGHIKFAGSVPPDPRLDLMLESQVNAYLVRVLISGLASKPVIELTSEPDLAEEDIMAVLLFGQPMNDLDSDQRGRMDEENDPSRELQKNLAGLAMAFGTKGLQDTMSDSFGVDLVQMGSDSSGASTLMVGKFITPDIILKYNQSLENSGTYFMTLEYSLNRYFKMVTTYGQGEEASGAELRWSKRY